MFVFASVCGFSVCVFLHVSDIGGAETKATVRAGSQIITVLPLSARG